MCPFSKGNSSGFNHDSQLQRLKTPSFEQTKKMFSVLKTFHTHPFVHLNPFLFGTTESFDKRVEAEPRLSCDLKKSKLGTRPYSMLPTSFTLIVTLKIQKAASAFLTINKQRNMIRGSHAEPQSSHYSKRSPFVAENVIPNLRKMQNWPVEGRRDRLWEWDSFIGEVCEEGSPPAL